MVAALTVETATQGIKMCGGGASLLLSLLQQLGPYRIGVICAPSREMPARSPNAAETTEKRTSTYPVCVLLLVAIKQAYL